MTLASRGRDGEAPMHALLVTYGLRGADAAEHAELSDELEPAFAAVPGLVSRTQLENAPAGRYGAFYVFVSKPAFDRFVASELYGATHGDTRLVDLTASDFSIRGHTIQRTRESP